MNQCFSVERCKYLVKKAGSPTLYVFLLTFFEYKHHDVAVAWFLGFRIGGGTKYSLLYSTVYDIGEVLLT
jgi:hypothetical protein